MASLSELTAADIGNLDTDTLAALLGDINHELADDRQKNQLLHYRPVSEHAAQVHYSDARVIGIGGGNGSCLPLESPVLMADHSWKSLGDVVVGDFVMGADPVSGLAVPTEVMATFRSGPKRVYRITFSDGDFFEASAEHEVPLYLGSGKNTSKGNPKLPHKRRIGDYLGRIREARGGIPKRISAVSPSDIQAPRMGPLIDPYLLGALLGDGGISTKSIKFFNADAAVVARVTQAHESMGGRVSRYDKITLGLVDCPELRAALTSFGLFGRTSHDKFLPDEVWGYDRDQRLELLAGLVDTDGGLNSYATVSERLASDFRALVRSVGGKATVAPRIVDGRRYFGIYWRVGERLPLSLPQKQAGDNPRKVDHRRRVCREVMDVGVKECGDIEVAHPSHCYITQNYVIVSNSKTETALAEITACATGVLPREMKETFRQKFRGPIQVRIICESLTTVLHPIILPKLQWWRWTGLGEPGSEQGHWGWVPQMCLKGGKWDKAWSEKLRMLSLVCRDPDNPETILGESSIQFMSFDQDPSDFASGDFHIVLMDEPPSHAIWIENEARTMRIKGRMMLSMTWPDDPAIPVDWIFDEVYDRGRPGPNKRADYDWFELYTTDNPHLNQEAIALQMSSWSDEIRRVRIFGAPIRFSNRIHRLFTDTDDFWCFPCGRSILPTGSDEGFECPECGSFEVAKFNHVLEFEHSQNWPVVYVLDPHPRKPHMMGWFQIRPDDDIDMVQELEVDGSPEDVRDQVFDMEELLGLNTRIRLLDPNMGRSPSSASRDLVWQDEFANVGLGCDLADSSDVGRSRLNDFLQPDIHTYRPRMHFHSRCQNAVYQIKRYTWDDHKRATGKDIKQKAREKYDDYPGMCRYLLNYDPDFATLVQGAPVLGRKGKRKGAY